MHLCFLLTVVVGALLSLAQGLFVLQPGDKNGQLALSSKAPSTEVTSHAAASFQQKQMLINPKDVEVYVDKTADYHQTRFTALHDTHRIVTLSVHGDRNDPRYSVTWVKRGGPAWQARHRLSYEELVPFLAEWVDKQKYTPTLIGATGPRDYPLFAIVVEKLDPAPASVLQRYKIPSGPDTTPGTLAAEMAANRAAGRYLKSIAMYGSYNDRQYAAIWLDDSKVVRKWRSRGDDVPITFQLTYDEETSRPFWHAAYITMDSDRALSTVYDDTDVGWRATRFGYDRVKIEAEIKAYVDTGYIPITLSGGGWGSDTRWAVTFAETDIPKPRKFTITGPVRDTALVAAEQIVRNFMQSNQIRGAQFAVMKNGNLMHSQAYTWAEPFFRVVQPSDRFMLASNSKMFLEAAMQFIYDNNYWLHGEKIGPNTKVYPLLSFSGPKDSRADTITLQQLLDHEGGYDASVSGFDANYNMRKIANVQELKRPVNEMDVAAYFYKNMTLDYNPGQLGAGCATGLACRYSNYGYILGSLAVEEITGQNFIRFVDENVLDASTTGEVIV